MPLPKTWRFNFLFLWKESWPGRILPWWDNKTVRPQEDHDNDISRCCKIRLWKVINNVCKFNSQIKITAIRNNINWGLFSPKETRFLLNFSRRKQFLFWTRSVSLHRPCCDRTYRIKFNQHRSILLAKLSVLLHL